MCVCVSLCFSFINKFFFSKMNVWIYLTGKAPQITFILYKLYNNYDDGKECGVGMLIIKCINWSPKNVLLLLPRRGLSVKIQELRYLGISRQKKLSNSSRRMRKRTIWAHFVWTQWLIAFELKTAHANRWTPKYL